MFFALLPLVSFAGGFTLTAENDLFFKTDRDYTHGTKLSYLFDSAPSWTDKLMKGEKRWATSLGQYIYSPKDIEYGQSSVNDRPYGGWLYLGNSISVRNGNRLDFFEIDVGVTGPNSLSEESQEIVHDWTGSQKPVGWENQIKERIGIDLAYQQKYKFGNDYVDIIPSYGGCLGNIFTYANVGVMGRVGLNLPDDFGFYKSEPNTRLSKDAEDIDWTKVSSVFIFVSGEERWVLENIFLDGETYEHHYMIEERPFVTDLMVGIGIIYGNINLIVADTFRSKEFYGQENPDRFSTISISISRPF